MNLIKDDGILNFDFYLATHRIIKHTRMPAPKVAIVILNWNGKHYLEKFLPTVRQTTYGNKQIVVVDNCSTDDSVAFIQQFYPEVSIVQLQQNYGFAKGYNEGLKQVEGDYYVLLNSDVAVTPGWIEPMVALCEQNSSIGVCQPKILQYHQPPYFEYAGAGGGWLDHWGYPFARGRIFDICEQDHGQYNDNVPVFWASGAAMFIRRALYHQLGGFDEFFFAHQEEIDLCWRAQREGYLVYACGEATVYHVGGGTLPKGNMRKVYLNFRNNLIMLAKNLPGARLRWVLLVRFCLDHISSLKAIWNGETRYAWAVIRAHKAFGKWWWNNRKIVGGKGKSTRNLKGYYAGSIVWAHFIRKRKTFREILGRKA